MRLQHLCLILFLAMLCSFFVASRTRAETTNLPPGIYFELKGLDFENDEFDGVISLAFGCLEETGKRMVREINERHKDGKQLRIPGCRSEQDLLNILARVFRETGDARPYLEARRGKCEPADGGTHCQVQRDVTTLSHTGDRSTGTKLRDLFTIDIFLSENGEPIRVTLTREGIGR